MTQQNQKQTNFGAIKGGLNIFKVNVMIHYMTNKRKDAKKNILCITISVISIYMLYLSELATFLESMIRSESSVDIYDLV